MSYVTLEQAKEHLLVIHDSDDGLIQQNINAAEAFAANYMNRPEIDDNPSTPWARNLPPGVASSEPHDPVPKNVVQAILLMTADFYENRTSGTIDAMSQSKNATVEALLWPNRIGMGI